MLVDRYSGWCTVSHFKPGQATAKNLIKECVALFSSYGAPEVFSSDGGTQFTSDEFQTFLGDWNVQHRASAPYYPQANRRAEATVKLAKRIISDYVCDSDPFNHVKIAQAIVQHRNTPLPDLKLSPAQLLLHRQIRDKLPTHPKHLRLHKQWVLTSMQREELFRDKNEASLQRYNRVSKELFCLKPRTRVLILAQEKNPRWTQSGVVVMELPFRRYKVKLDGSGRIITRNRRFLRTYHSMDNISNQLDYSLIRPFERSLPVQSSTQLSSQSSQQPANHSEQHIATPEVHRIPRELRPHNRPGLLECENQVAYRTTRSNRSY